MTRTVCTTLALTVALLPAAASSAEVVYENGVRTVRGAVAGAPVVPRVIEVDLRELPKAKGWRPGDPVKSVPRRHRRAAVPVPKPIPRIDPLLGRLNQGDALNQVRALSAPQLNFAGQGYSGVNPPDTVGDIGKNYYIQAINGGGGTRFVVYNNTTGAIASGPTTLASLGGTGSCNPGAGDPIVLYDEQAERWLIAEFGPSSVAFLCVYISITDNPVTGGWMHYQFNTPSFPDYPKYGVWNDAYYVTSNEGSPKFYALDRTKMLLGQAATFQGFSAAPLNGFSFQALTPADVDGPPPPANAPGIFMRHRDDEAHNSGSNNASQDFLELFTLSMDFANAGNSVLTGPISIPIAEFDSDLNGLTAFSAIPQPGTSTELDPLREVVMHRLQYRNFTTYETLVGSFVTDVNGNDHAGVRWFELRKSGGGAWGLHQEGTYAPDAHNRWMSSIAMDGSGNIALAYNISSATVFPGLRYTGRLASDPLGTMPQGESNLVAGAAANGSNRYGDYAALSVDPEDHCTFWFTGEYNASSTWSTRVGSFAFDACGCTPPAAPSNVLAQGNGNHQVLVTWPAVSGATSYNIYMATGTCASSASAYSLLATSYAGTSYVHNTSLGGTTNAYKVASVGSGVCVSAPGSCASAVVPGLCSAPPSFAGATSATPLAGPTCALRVEWNAADPGCGGVVAYNLYRSADSGFTPGVSNLLATCLSDTTYDDYTVASGTSYYYVVRAENLSPDAGPCAGGRSESNTVRKSALTFGSGIAVFFDDLESGAGAWSASALPADTGLDPWSLVTDQSQSPTHAFFCSDQENIKDQVVGTASAIAVPLAPPSTLEFWQLYELETSFDGGVLEYSTDGGSTWFDILAGNGGSVPAANRITQGGYDQNISTGYDSPIGGREAWTGALGEFSKTVVDLADMAGLSVKFRWRLACDSSVAATGWWIDDIVLSYSGSCAQGGYEGWRSDFTWTSGSGLRSEDESSSGRPNFEAYFFGYNPLVPPTPLALDRYPRVLNTSTGLFYTFQQATNQGHAANYVIRRSTNLLSGSWSPILPGPLPDPDGRVRLPVSQPGDDQHLRLDITE